MAQYAYKAIDRKGKPISGLYEASGLEDLEYRLSNNGLDLVTAQPARQSQTLFARKRLTRRDLIVFFIDLEQMATAGIPIIESLAEMRDSIASPTMREILSGLIDAISGGKTLSEAMAAYPKIFNQMTIKLIVAGEKSGNMAHVFKEAKDALRWEDDVVRKTRKLASYPAFVGTVVFAVVCFLMIYLVPKLVTFILSMDQEVPFMTRTLIATSEIFVNHWVAILIAPIVFFIASRQLLKRSRRARLWYDEHKLSVPLLGEAMQKLLLSRFTRNFALLYDAGVSILDCLKISQETVTNTYLAGELEYIREQVAEGATLNEAFATARLFPPLVLRMLKVGETTGELGTSITNVSEFYSRDVNELIDRIQAKIEPGMTIFLGLILGWIMLSVLGPIYSVITKIQF